MLILFHGSGDDDLKVENFMPALARLLRERYNEVVLVLPGVGSKQRGQVGDRAKACYRFIKQKAMTDHWPEIHETARPKIPSALSAAIQAAMPRFSATAYEIPSTYMAWGTEGMEIEKICKAPRSEAYKTSRKAVGVKSRMSLAACCAIAYKRLGGPDPIRIVGHSRGGSSAVGAHNLIAFHGFKSYTLTLDPCHGVNKTAVFGRTKDYYSKVWSGTLINLPVKKGIKVDTLDWIFERPTISMGTGANPETSVTNYPRLNNMRHGNMGKFLTMPKTVNNKREWQNGIEARIDAYIRGLPVGVPLHDALHNFFNQINSSEILVAASDRAAIVSQVVDAICSGGMGERLSGPYVPFAEPEVQNTAASVSPARAAVLSSGSSFFMRRATLTRPSESFSNPWDQEADFGHWRDEDGDIE
mgnify:CR=1 FL=1